MEGDDNGKAYTAIVRGGILSRESYFFQRPRPLTDAEGNMSSAVNARRCRSAVVEDPITHKRIMSELGRPRTARSRFGDPGPRQEVLWTKLSGKARGVGRLRSTCEASNKAEHHSVAESVEGRRPVGRKASGDTSPGLRAGIGVSPQPRAYEPAELRRLRLTLDRSPLRESRTVGSVRGDRGNPVPYRDP
jgi:hypothetical protein